MKSRYLAVALIVVIVALIYFNAALYLQNKNETQPYDPKTTEAFRLYNEEFGVPPNYRANYSFATPVSSYSALRIALEDGGWTKNSLEGMRVGLSLGFIRFTNSSFRSENQAILSPMWSMEVLSTELTEPMGDYSPVKIGDNTYRYIWTISVRNATTTNIRPYSYCYVDAATAEIIPHGPLL